MSRWFRVDDGLVDDPKVQQLPDRLFRAVVNLWCITSQNSGNFPPIDQIAFKLRTTAGKAEKIIGELRAAELIDEDDAGTRPHNWNGRQFKSDVTDPTAAERQKKYRNAKRNATVTQAVTVTDTRAETEQIQSRTDIAPDGASANGKTYAFEDGVIRLTPKDFSKWEQAFSNLNLRAELLSLSKWAAEQGQNWFHALKGALAKRNRDAKTAAQNAARAGQLPLTPAGNPWPEGIV